MVRSMVYCSIEICMYVSLIALGLTMTQGLGHEGTRLGSNDHFTQGLGHCGRKLRGLKKMHFVQFTPASLKLSFV